MRTLLLYVALFSSAFFIAISVPRQVRPELRLLSIWEYSFTENNLSWQDGLNADSVIPFRHFETEDEYALLDSRDGSVLRRGLKGNVFSASAYGFINQPENAQRWVVQSWKSLSARYFDARGTPNLVGSVLVQNDGESLHVTDLADDRTVSMKLPPGLIAYDIGSTTSGPIVVTADVTGNIQYLSKARATVFNIHDEPFKAPPASIVYGVSGLPSGDVVVLHGLSPQTVSVVSIESTEAFISFEIEREEAVRYGVNITDYEDGRYVIIPLVNGLGIIDLQDERFQRVEMNISGDKFRADSQGRYTLISGNFRNDSYHLLIHNDTGETVTWGWEGSRHVGLESDPFRMFLAVNGTVIAVGMEL